MFKFITVTAFIVVLLTASSVFAEQNTGGDKGRQMGDGSVRLVKPR